MTAPILMAALCSFWGCDKDEDHLSEAVLASANTLNFEAERAAEKIITIYADADWVTEVPDWVTVTPNSGTGVMDVTVSVTDNMRDGAEDNPRKATLVFKGRTLASRAQVLITQNGDKYRDVKEYTAGELAALADETVISVPSAIVVAVTTKGFVISDDKNTDNIFVSDATTVAVGDKISLLGTKSSDSQKLATVIDCDEVTVLSGGAVNYPEPEDISAKIDDYTSSKRGYVTVKGVFNGSTLTVSEDAKYSVSVVDAPSSLGLSALTGHIVTVTGYYAGLAEPVQRIMATDVEDNGLNEIVYFLENFEWLEPYSAAGSAGRSVETDDLSANAPALTSVTVDGVTGIRRCRKTRLQVYLRQERQQTHLPPAELPQIRQDRQSRRYHSSSDRRGSRSKGQCDTLVRLVRNAPGVRQDRPRQSDRHLRERQRQSADRHTRTGMGGWSQARMGSRRSQPEGHYGQQGYEDHHYADAVGSRNSQPLVPRQYQNIRTDQTLITGTL